MMIQTGPGRSICVLSPAHESQVARDLEVRFPNSHAVASLFFFSFFLLISFQESPAVGWASTAATRKLVVGGRISAADDPLLPAPRREGAPATSDPIPMAYRRKQGGAVAADDRRSSYPQDSASSHSYTSFRSVEEPKLGLWETLARKAKGILDEDGLVHKFEDLRKESPRGNPVPSSGDQVPQSRWSFENNWKPGDAASRIRPEALSASVNQLSGRIKNALEEGLTIVDHKTSSIIQETKKIQIRRKPANNSYSHMPNSTVDTLSTPNLSLDQTESAAQGTQLKASRDVANAMAAKAKLLLRELKSVKADLAFAKQRCGQLEEENKLLRETKQKGSKPEDDDDLIRVQLETLLAEKSRLAQENSTYARENRFLREIVEFHQFTAHDVVSLDDGDMEDDDDQEEDSNLIHKLPAVEENSEHEELSHVPSRPESPVPGAGETSSPKSSNSHSVTTDSPNTVSEPNASASV